MINSVSAVSFKANPQVAQDPISRVGAFTKQPEDVAVPKKKSHKFLKTVAGIVAGAIVLNGALLVGAKKGWFKPLEQGLENAKFMEKVSDKLYKAGEWLNQNAWQKIAGLFNRNKAEQIIEEEIQHI